MNRNENYYKRIDYIDDINNISKLVCEEYNLGTLIVTHEIYVGYEDFNAVLETSTGKYLIKIFNNSRSDKEVYDVINREYIAYLNGVKTPKVYKNSKDEIVTIIKYLDSRFRLSLIEYIDGNDFFQLNRKPTMDELLRLVDIASCMCKIDNKLEFIYDTWAITSFCNEFEKKSKYINDEYLDIIEPIYDKFKKFNYEKLPKGFVHGDLLSTNVMLDNNKNIWAIDFSVSNYTARLNEIVVICGDLAIVLNNKKKSETRIKKAFNAWCDKVNATDYEKESFQMLLEVAGAIKILNPAYEIVNGDNSKETKMHLDIGLFVLTLFK